MYAKNMCVGLSVYAVAGGNCPWCGEAGRSLGLAGTGGTGKQARTAGKDSGHQCHFAELVYY